MYLRGWALRKLRTNGRKQGRKEEGRREGRYRKEGLRRVLSLLDSTDGLDLEGLSVGAELSVVLVLSSVTVTLHDVLVSTVTRILVAHPAVEEREMFSTQGLLLK